jgi:NAD+ kinase
MKRVGILYHPKIEAAFKLAEELERLLHSGDVSLWLCSAWDEEKVRPQIADTDLAVSIGGDGTILRVVRAVIPWSTPVLGINLGKLGFMTELGAAEARDKLPALLKGAGWIEERAMLEARLFPAGDRQPPESLQALNDVVVGRGGRARVIRIETKIDDTPLTTYKADGVIIATATGSTGYSLAAGGPILHPQAREVLLKAISPHLTMAHALVLPPAATVELRVITDHQAMLSIDGQVELPLESGDRVKVNLSSHVARFLRTGTAASLYSTLEQRLRGKE